MNAANRALLESLAVGDISRADERIVLAAREDSEFASWLEHEEDLRSLLTGAAAQFRSSAAVEPEGLTDAEVRTSLRRLAGLEKAPRPRRLRFAMAAAAAVLVTLSLVVALRLGTGEVSGPDGGGLLLGSGVLAELKPEGAFELPLECSWRGTLEAGEVFDCEVYAWDPLSEARGELLDRAQRTTNVWRPRIEDAPGGIYWRVRRLDGQGTELEVGEAFAQLSQ